MNPVRALRHAVSRLVNRDTAETQPPEIMKALSRRSRRLGIEGINVLFSFDCDTPEDAAAAKDVFAQLRRRAVPAAFAVPGTTLQLAAEQYRELSRLGAGFINHGYRPHTEHRDGRYHAITFYDQMSPDDVARDIREGHDTVTAVIGRRPVGFRGPHFGSFQKPEQRRVVYDAVHDLGYAFCSDTLPGSAYESGPVFEVGRSLKELPLTGSLRDPFVILDSWNYLADRTNYRLQEEYGTRFAETIDFFAERRLPVLLNYYADPAHVVGDAIFLGAIDHALSAGARFRSFEEILELTGGR
jgi:hypothetical protein